MMRSILGTSLRNETVFVAAMSLALLLSSAKAYGDTDCSLEPNTYDPADFALVLENFEQTTTLSLVGSEWDNTLVRNCKVHDTGGDGIFLKDVRNVVVQNCEVWNISGKGIKTSSWASTWNVTIDGNYVHDISESGIWSGENSVTGVDHENLKVLNNVVENIGLENPGPHPIYLQSSDFLIQGNVITGLRSGNGISVRSSGVVRCNHVSGPSILDTKAGIRYFSNHSVGLSNTLIIERNHVISDTPGIHLYRPVNRKSDNQPPPDHVVKNFIIRYNTVAGNPDILVEPEYDDPIYSVEVYDNPPPPVPPPDPDPTPPTVMLTSPLVGDILFGTVTITADASDNVAVAKVEFFIDGVFLGSDPIAPYSIALDTVAYIDGLYVIEAESVDTSGNRSSRDPVLVEIDNAGNPPPTLTDHVEDIAVQLRKIGNKWLVGQAVVTVLDGDSVPVATATVFGSWSGLTSESVSGLTAVDGTVRFNSQKVPSSSTGQFVFTVNDVEAAGYTYDPNLNLETGDCIDTNGDPCGPGSEPPGETILQVSNPVVRAVPVRKHWRGEATVTVSDQLNPSVSGAVVTGNWEFETTGGTITILDTSNGTTDSSGVAVLLSPKHKADSGDVFRFFVNDVTLPGATYDPGSGPPPGEDTVP